MAGESKKQIELKIAAGTYSIAKNESGKADIWKQKQMGLIVKNGNESALVKGFAACFKCSSVFSFGPSLGSSHLTRHAAECYSTLKQKDQPGTAPPLTQFLTKALTKQQCDRLIEACCGFIAIDLHPFSAIEGKGLKFCDFESSGVYIYTDICVA